MTDDEAMALGLRAVATKHWRWMGGMKDMQGRTVTPCILFRSHPTDTPDFRDPATMGCLLALVRGALKCPEAHVYYATVSRLWVVRWGVVGVGQRSVDALTEAEALVAALEAAPA